MTFVRVNIGHLIGDEAAASPPLGQHMVCSLRYYEDIQNYLMALMGLVHLIEVGRSGSSAPLRATDTVKIDCATVAASWYWGPHEAVADIAANLVPSRLLLERQPSSASTPGPMSLGALGRLLEGFGQVLATNYFERFQPAIKAKFGNDPNAHWPSVWNFARVVRNAMSHKGVIHFSSGVAAPVSWRGLTYSPADNGRPILHTEIWPGDLFDLLQEMDTHLT